MQSLYMSVSKRVFLGQNQKLSGPDFRLLFSLSFHTDETPMHTCQAHCELLQRSCVTHIVIPVRLECSKLLPPMIFSWQLRSNRPQTNLFSSPAVLSAGKRSFPIIPSPWAAALLESGLKLDGKFLVWFTLNPCVKRKPCTYMT